MRRCLYRTCLGQAKWILFFKSDQSLMQKISKFLQKSSSVKLSTSTGDEQEIKISEEIDGILKHNNRILTGKVSLIYRISEYFEFR